MNWWDEIRDATRLEGRDPMSRMVNPPPGPGPGPLETTLAEMYGDFFKQTSPLRRNLINQSRRFLAGGFDPTSTESYSAVRSLANNQASMAKDNILSSLPGGGVLLDKLADVDIDKARTMTAASSDIYNNELNMAMSLATGAPFQSSAGGMGGLAQNEMARIQANSSQRAGQKNSMGAAAGGVAGAFLTRSPQGAAAGASAGGSIGRK